MPYPDDFNGLNFESRYGESLKSDAEIAYENTCYAVNDAFNQAWQNWPLHDAVHALMRGKEIMQNCFDYAFKTMERYINITLTPEYCDEIERAACANQCHLKEATRQCLGSLMHLMYLKIEEKKNETEERYDEKV